MDDLVRIWWSKVTVTSDKLIHFSGQGHGGLKKHVLGLLNVI